ncbi:hypothetical protein KAU25_04035 [Candidatus Bathyarchaeota archaeon]|nr:hypothetical protein [Candidatus Bathyarchaeota archaeon]
MSFRISWIGFASKLKTLSPSALKGKPVVKGRLLPHNGSFDHSTDGVQPLGVQRTLLRFRMTE